MNAVWDDPRVVRGMKAQLRLWGERLRAGEKALGWKLAFGAPAALARLNLSAPVIGFLTDRAPLPSGAVLSLSSWTKPVVEPEIAIYVGKDLPGGADREQTRAAIAALGPAFELADVARPQVDVEDVLANNINQRNVILGARDESRAGAALQGLSGRLLRNGREVAHTSDLEAMTGELVFLVQHVANMLAAFGETLRSGQVIIAGAVMAPVWVETAEEVVFQLDPIGAVSVIFSAHPVG